jgi:AhpD family alkylhydroperoxidase
VTHYHEEHEELRAQYAEVRGRVPEVTAGYAALQRAAMAEGELTSKTKELLALAIAITRQCDGCITAHARSAARRGVTAQEVAEAVGVCIAMNGGPATVYGSRALAAYESFAEQAATTATTRPSATPAIATPSG